MNLRSRMNRGALLGLAASLSAAASAPPACAQYYYQPAPGYYRNDTLEGTVAGGGLGAVTGAIIGGRKQRGEGALIGAGVGALAGNILGRSADRADERQAAVGSAVVGQANAQAAAMALANHDLVEMTRAGVSEDVIISAIQSRGGRFDVSPAGLISLKQSGVSDRVVSAAQNLQTSGYAPQPAAAVIAPPPVIYTRPAPAVRVYVGPGWHGHYHHYHGHRHCHW